MSAPCLTVHDWGDRPVEFQPYPTWAEAHAAWAAAYMEWSDAFTANRRLSAPFIANPDTDPQQKHSYIFSRTAAERLEKAPELPADLMASDFREEAAKAALEVARSRAIQTPATGREILVKLRLITGPMDDVFDPSDPTDVQQARKRPDEFPLALEFLALNDDLVRALPIPTPDRAAWDTAYARWTAACARRLAAQIDDAARTEAINRQAPVEIRGRSRHQDHSARWLTEEYVNGDILLTTTEKARLRPIVRDWHDARCRLLDDSNASFDDEAWNAIHDEADAAEIALMSAQPPGLAELVILQRIGACRISEQDDDTTGGFDDLGWVAFTDEGFWTVNHVCETHRHTLRLAGIDHPILHMERFSPRKWIAAYEAAGQSVSIAHRCMILTVPAEEADTDPTAVLRAELAATAWKYWAVQLSANQRQDGGGDPFYDAAGYSGPMDGRGHGGRPAITVMLADLIQFSAAPDGGSPIPHVTRVDNRVQA